MTGPPDAGAVAHVFVDALDDRCDIEGDDGHHLRRALRVTPGERVTAADGTGSWRVYEVVAVTGHGLALDARGDVNLEPEPPVAVALAVALAKGGLDMIVASATELGVTRITPLRTERTVVRWDAQKAESGVARLRAVARAAAMQCRRARIPVVDDVGALADLAARPAVVVADRTGRRSFELAPPASGEWTVVVGPEGGLAAAELAPLADRPRLALGEHVLRAVTAPVAAVAVLGDRIAQMRAAPTPERDPSSPA